ncbi:MAG: glycosyltransferase family 2 protein [Candidatus Moraniibacteriota bacterium]|nr:MAG: glycosyltransferase family 2 protein [Candidatus Moranbacteria bacterium]
MDVSIIIVNYRSREKTRGCLLSLQKADFSNISHEILVVDNSETADIDSSFQAEFPEVQFLYAEKNRGMGAGNNLAATKAEGKFLLILNPDTAVRKTAVSTLFSLLRDRPDIGIVGPKLLNPDGTLQYSCLRFPEFWTPIFRRTFLGRWAPRHLARYLMIDFDHCETRDVDWMMGSCLMIRTDFYRRAGGFDERFFMYFEDIDLCRRAWREGLRVVYCPQAEVVHDHGRGSARDRWFIAPFTSRLAREHILSWLKYGWKWRFR